MKRNKKYRSVGQKLVSFYVLLGMIPLVVVSLYLFGVLRSALYEDGYRYIRQEAEEAGSLMDAWAERYEAIMDSIYMDYYTNAYIMADYSETGYESMYPYIDKTLLKLSLLCPENTQIEFYSLNATLPEDGNYFRRTEEMEKAWFHKAVEANGFTVVAGVDEGEKPGICLVKLMNYFKNGSLQNILQMRVEADSICSRMQTGDSNYRKYVLNSDGRILAAADRSKTGLHVDELEELITWERLRQEPEGKLLEYGRNYMVTKDCRLGMKILVAADRAAVLEKAEKMAGRILFLLISTAVLAFGGILLYARRFGQRINRIVFAAGRLKKGGFDYRIQDRTKDEIGKVADAMDDLTGKMEILIRENYQKQLRLRDSEINLLYEQIDPHFLYNALSTISSLSIMEGDRLTNRCVKALGEFYRVSLNQGKRMLSIREEVELLKSYMVIQKFRFDDSVEMDCQAEAEIMEYRCLKLLLQPVVENSVKYGMRDNNGMTLHIKVRVYGEEDTVCFLVEDDGMGMEPERLEEVNAAVREGNGGYGLKNIDVRVKLQYGPSYGLRLESKRGKGTRVLIRIPKDRGENGDQY